MKTATARYILAALIIAGYFGTLHALLRWGIPQVNSEPIWILIGGLQIAFAAVVQYFFGSSSGSTAKDAVLAKQANGNLAPQGPQPPGATQP